MSAETTAGAPEEQGKTGQDSATEPGETSTGAPAEPGETGLDSFAEPGVTGVEGLGLAEELFEDNHS